MASLPRFRWPDHRFDSDTSVGHGRGRIVRALNGYRKLRGASRASCVGDRVTENIGQRLAGRAQSLNGSISVIY